MGNFPLCIPKQDGIVFRDCPNNSSDFILHHRFEIDDDVNVKRNEQRDARPRDDTSHSNEPQGMDDAAVLGVELDQDSVCA